jgi:hypothetical protein
MLKKVLLFCLLGVFLFKFLGCSPTESPKNKPPTDINLSNSSIQEDSPIGSFVGIFSCVDADVNDEFTFSLISGTGDNDNADFEISTDTLKTKKVFDYNIKNSYSIRVQVKDKAGETYEKSFNITIIHVNHSPTSISLSNTEIADTISLNSFVGKLTAEDKDIGDKITFSLVSGDGDTNNSSFKISGDSLLVNTILDATIKSTYSIRIQAKDNGNASFEKSFSITVVHCNSAPTDIILSDSVIEETAPEGSTVGQLSAVDKDKNDKFTFALVGGDTTDFEIFLKYLNTKTKLNYATKSTYTLKIRVSDGNGGTFEKTFTIYVKQVEKIDSIAAIFTERENITISTTISASTNIWDQPDAEGRKTYLNWMPYDHFEGSKAYQITTNNSSWSGWGFQTYNISIEEFKDGRLHIAIMGNTPDIGIGMASSNTQTPTYVKATDYGYKPDGEWHELWIPLSVWASSVDFKDITMIVGFICPAYTGGNYVQGSMYTVDDIFLTKK